MHFSMAVLSVDFCLKSQLIVCPAEEWFCLSSSFSNPTCPGVCLEPGGFIDYSSAERDVQVNQDISLKCYLNGESGQ